MQGVDGRESLGIEIGQAGAQRLVEHAEEGDLKSAAVVSGRLQGQMFAPLQSLQNLARPGGDALGHARQVGHVDAV